MKWCYAPTGFTGFCFVLFQIMAVYSCKKYNIYGSANTLKKKCSLSIRIHLIDLLVEEKKHRHSYI